MIEDDKTETKSGKTSNYAYLVLAIICMIRIAVNWQNKSLGYFTGFTGVGAMAGSPVFEISKAYPLLS